MDALPNRTWAEINIDNLVHNYKQFVKTTRGAAKVMCVVKSNGYGHGSVTVSKHLLDAGCDYLAVASLDEALELRNACIGAPLLVLNYITPWRISEAIKANITITVFSTEMAECASDCGEMLGIRPKVHIKIDTGMSRVGFNYDEFDLIAKVCDLPLNVEGLFTHFACADETDQSFTLLQFERFMEIVRKLESKGIHIPLKHACNSAAAINHPQMHLDMIRPGISLYGFYPSEEVDWGEIDLRPVMSLKSKVIRVNEVEAGAGVSYGHIFKTDRKSKIATIPIGYADGFTRMLTQKARAIVNGKHVNIVGRICMDQCMIDVTDVSDVSVGSEVVLFGDQLGASIHVDEVAKSIGTINYEIVCMVARRVPRYYIKDSKIISCENYIL